MLILPVSSGCFPVYESERNSAFKVRNSGFHVLRFFPDSCDPNLIARYVYTADKDRRIPRIVFFAKRDIADGEFLRCLSLNQWWVLRRRAQLRLPRGHVGGAARGRVSRLSAGLPVRFLLASQETLKDSRSVTQTLGCFTRTPFEGAFR